MLQSYSFYSKWPKIIAIIPFYLSFYDNKMMAKFMINPCFLQKASNKFYYFFAVFRKISTFAWLNVDGPRANTINSIIL